MENILKNTLINNKSVRFNMFTIIIKTLSKKEGTLLKYYNTIIRFILNCVKLIFIMWKRPPEFWFPIESFDSSIKVK